MEALTTKADRFVEITNGCGSDYTTALSYCRGIGFGLGTGQCIVEGSGAGNGSNEGDGYGYGFDEWDGYGYGVASFCGQKVYKIDNVPTLIDHVHGNAAKGRILLDDLTTDDCYIVKQGIFFAHGKTLREAMDALRDKLFEDMPEEERIAEFVKAHEWGKQYPSADYYDWHHRLTGSCDIGWAEFAKRHGYKLTHDELLAVDEFIRLTESSYGGSVIKKLREAYCQH